MILGSLSVNGDAVVTHRDSYLLKSLSVVSVRRVFLAPAILFGAGFTGFGIAFSDLLYQGEITAILVASFVAIIAGTQIGQLKLLSRDLRGSELSGVIWGRYSHLNHARSQIIQKLSTAQEEDS